MSVIYLMSGPAHLPYLVVSLQSLREKANYQGHITVYAWPESYPLVERIAIDAGLDIEVREREPEYRGKNAQFYDKVRLVNEIEEPTLYLDADTMPVQSVMPLLQRASNGYFVATQFCNWVSSEGQPRKRVEKLRDYPIDQTPVNVSLGHRLPSPNGGVFAFSGMSQMVLSDWLEWTSKTKETLFIADETCLHAVCAKWRGFYVNVYPGVWNCSPKFVHCEHSDVRIWHFHGDSNVRPHKSQLGYDLWWPEFKRCLALNVGDMQNWIADINNRFIKELMNEDDQRFASS